MKLPDYPIESLWDTLDEESKEHFPGLFYDGAGRLWFADGFRAVCVQVQHAENDVAGWVPTEIVHYARTTNRPRMTLMPNKILCGAADFARTTTPRLPSTKTLERLVSSSCETDGEIEFIVDLKLLAPLVALLNESAQASRYRTVMCRFKQSNAKAPLVLETRLPDMHTLLMPMRLIGESKTLPDMLIQDDDDDDDYRELTPDELEEWRAFQRARA